MAINTCPRHRDALEFGLLDAGMAVVVQADSAFPMPTHSKEALRHDNWGTGEDWDRHEVRSAGRPLAPTCSGPELT